MAYNQCLTCGKNCRKEYCHLHDEESKQKKKQALQRYRKTLGGKIAQNKAYEKIKKSLNVENSEDN